MIKIVLTLFCAGILTIGNASLVLAADQSLKNTLKQHPSPYLAMHGDDPVHWQNWDKAVFERARRENKLVFVSIGYFACHWCHVMQRESYRNKKIAAMLNRDFIPVKVDRELQPALDARLIEFVEKTRGYAGWPLNVFITPDGYPLLGIVYLPADDFSALLTNMHQAWTADRRGMQVMAESAASLWQQGEASTGPGLDADRLKAWRADYLIAAMKSADSFQGGFGEDNKFPMVPQLVLLLDIYRDTKDQGLRDFLLLTLDKMATQGLYDQLRGGFYRYVVDPGWKIPHFEKMLYDNALLANLYLDAAALFDKPAYSEVALQAIDFVERELSHASGGLISSLSAIDDKHVEGGYYLWRDEELKALLTTEQLQLMRLHWGLQHAPELEGGHHARIALGIQDLANKTGQPAEKIRQTIADAKTRLKQHQQQRILPRDDKLLASWNGLALSALTRAGKVKPAYLARARAVRDFIVGRLWDGQSLHRAVADNQYLGHAGLEDYAYVADGLLAWVRQTGSAEDRRLLQQIVSQAWKRFYSDRGWLLSEDMIPGIATREGIIADGPMPSPSATLIRVTLQLAQMNSDRELLQQARVALNHGHRILQTDNFWYATHVLAMTEAMRIRLD